MSERENTIYISGGLETSDYGIDLYGTRKLPELMDKICKAHPECNFVIGWLHPAGIDDELLAVISQNENIAEVMVHIQHANDKLLSNMGRPSRSYTHEKITALKAAHNLRISTEVIVGFPDEGEEEFKELIDYLDLGLFDDIAVAGYERVLDTKAALLPNMPYSKQTRERMAYIASRYDAKVYSPPKRPMEPVLESYIKAHTWLKGLPKMVKLPEARQKYSNIAGIDTECKERGNFGELLSDLLKKVISSRDALAIKKLRKEVTETYTKEFREYAFNVLKDAFQKEAIIKRAEQILL